MKMGVLVNAGAPVAKALQVAGRRVISIHLDTPQEDIGRALPTADLSIMLNPWGNLHYILLGIVEKQRLLIQSF